MSSLLTEYLNIHHIKLDFDSDSDSSIIIPIKDDSCYININNDDDNTIQKYKNTINKNRYK